MSPAPALRFDFTPPPDWERSCSEKASLFNSPVWHQVLWRGFSARSLYARETSGDTAFSINIFKAGPFRIGYLGFPIGGPLSGSLTSHHLKELQLARPPLDVLRIPVSGLGSLLDVGLHSAALPETVIANLEGWQLTALPKLRRDLNKAGRSGLKIHDINKEYHGQMFKLYKDTVLAHSGSLRYTPEYFFALLELSQDCQNIRCLGAFDNNVLNAFVVIALDKDTGYYLHGATSSCRKSTGISDLLVYSAIEWAKLQGMARFNLMTSPISQPGLVRYKEKFGATTLAHRTYEVSIYPIRARLFKTASWAHNLVAN